MPHWPEMRRGNAAELRNRGETSAPSTPPFALGFQMAMSWGWTLPCWTGGFWWGTLSLDRQTRHHITRTLFPMAKKADRTAPSIVGQLVETFTEHRDT
jgi:hypothetical protein